MSVTDNLSNLFKSHIGIDSMCVVQWLKDMDGRGLLRTYFDPPLTPEERKIAKIEGWILGIY
jgi:hypothetical protein